MILLLIKCSHQQASARKADLDKRENALAVVAGGAFGRGQFAGIAHPPERAETEKNCETKPDTCDQKGDEQGTRKTLTN
jgi:hypothetical protein